MKTRLSAPTLVASTALAAACALGSAAQAEVISATATAASTLPATVPVSQDLQNGDFLIHANTQAALPHVTGDGLDEATSWSFDFTSNPNYAAFMADGSLVGARLTLTLNTAFFDNGAAPITDLVRPSDAGGDVFPAWVLPSFMNGVAGTYSSATLSESLITVGMDPGALFNWLASHSGLFPMLYADDALVTAATLTLVSAPVPEPGAAALLLAGLLGLSGLRRRMAPRGP